MQSHLAAGRRGALAAAVAASVLALAGMGAVVAGLSAPDSPPAPAAAASSPGPSAPSPEPSPAPTTGGTATDLDVPALPFAEPVGLEVPSIGVSSSTLVPLGRLPDGELQVPADFDLPGWYVDGPAPGEYGPAVIAGHVDSTDGPAVFFRLGEVRPGAKLAVSRADGSTARFEVYRVQRYAKDQFPSAEVYGDTTQRSELRLITCGGEFDRSTGHYVDNVVVYAHLV